MTTAILTVSILLVILGSYTAGVITGPSVLARLMPAQGAHAVPPSEVERSFAHSRPQPSQLLAIEPPPTVRADLPVKPARTTGPQPWHTAPFAAVPDEPAEEQTSEQTHDLYFGGDWGTMPQLEAAQAQNGAQMAEVRQ